MSKREKEAISIFLHDLYHHKQIKRRMHELKEKFNENDLLVLIDDLEEKGILDWKEKKYLYRRVKKLYKSRN